MRGSEKGGECRQFSLSNGSMDEGGIVTVLVYEDGHIERRCSREASCFYSDICSYLRKSVKGQVWIRIVEG